MERTPDAGLQNVSSPTGHAFRAVRSRAVRDRTDVAGMAAQARIGADPASGFTMSIPADSFLSALQVFAAHERMDPLMLLCKLTEECGELAEAVLVERGFNADRIEAVGRGEREPLVPTDDDVVEPRNRRADIEVR